VFARGWCSAHYSRWQRHGDVNTTLRTPPSTKNATEKFCPRCHATKQRDQFGTRANGTPKGYCRECDAAYQASHAATAEGREMRRMARAKWNDGNHEYFLQYRYGITLADYDRMLVDQAGRCAICGTTDPGGRLKVWSVDHCHNSNKVRGLLCRRCNMGLGYFKDDTDRLLGAVAYLDRHRSKDA
jgi:hypothetical protein